MYYDDHPPPHFHVRYGSQKAVFDIESLALVEGKLAVRAMRLVREWAELHSFELFENWDLAREEEPLSPIDPLP
jgi:hypothetical protein